MPCKRCGPIKDCCANFKNIVISNSANLTFQPRQISLLPWPKQPCPLPIKPTHSRPLHLYLHGYVACHWCWYLHNLTTFSAASPNHPAPTSLKDLGTHHAPQTPGLTPSKVLFVDTFLWSLNEFLVYQNARIIL